MLYDVLPGLAPKLNLTNPRRSDLMFHLRAEDGLRAVSGQDVVFSRGVNSGLVRGYNGLGGYPSAYLPRMHCFDLDGDGKNEVDRKSVV